MIFTAVVGYSPRVTVGINICVRLIISVLSALTHICPSAVLGCMQSHQYLRECVMSRTYPPYAHIHRCVLGCMVTNTYANVSCPVHIHLTHIYTGVMLGCMRRAVASRPRGRYRQSGFARHANPCLVGLRRVSLGSVLASMSEVQIMASIWISRLEYVQRQIYGKYLDLTA